MAGLGSPPPASRWVVLGGLSPLVWSGCPSGRSRGGCRRPSPAPADGSMRLGPDGRGGDPAFVPEVSEGGAGQWTREVRSLPGPGGRIAGKPPGPGLACHQPVVALQELETAHLVPLKVMNAVGAALEPADDDGALRQVNVLPAQIARLRDSQAMAVDDQPDQPIPMAIPVAFEAVSSLSTSDSVRCYSFWPNFLWYAAK